MTEVAILYFSGFGHTKKLAEEVASGVNAQENAEARLIEISQEGEIQEEEWNVLAKADAIVYGSPTYMGGPAWQFKKVADQSSKIWFVQGWKNKVAGGFTVSASTNGDKAGTISAFMTLSQQHGQIWVGTGLMPANSKDSTPADINWTAGMSGLLAIAPSDASPEEAPAGGDLLAAAAYGQRLVEISQKFR